MLNFALVPSWFCVELSSWCPISQLLSTHCHCYLLVKAIEALSSLWQALFMFKTCARPCFFWERLSHVVTISITCCHYVVWLFVVSPVQDVQQLVDQTSSGAQPLKSTTRLPWRHKRKSTTEPSAKETSKDAFRTHKLCSMMQYVYKCNMCFVTVWSCRFEDMLRQHIISPNCTADKKLFAPRRSPAP